jgi:hypothetical protein
MQQGPPPTFDPSNMQPTFASGGGGFDPAILFVLVAVLAGIGLVVHFAMAAMVMREARAAGENPMAWGMLAFSRPVVGYALWKSQGRGGAGAPTPMIGIDTGPGQGGLGVGMGLGGPGMNPYGPPGMGWPQSPGNPGNAGAPPPTPMDTGASAPPPPDPGPTQSSGGSDSMGTGQIISF